MQSRPLHHFFIGLLHFVVGGLGVPSWPENAHILLQWFAEHQAFSGFLMGIGLTLMVQWLGGQETLHNWVRNIQDRMLGQETIWTVKCDDQHDRGFLKENPNNRSFSRRMRVGKEDEFEISCPDLNAEYTITVSLPQPYRLKLESTCEQEWEGMSDGDRMTYAVWAIMPANADTVATVKSTIYRANVI